MGTGFSIDTPLKVARYGISSAISLVDDVLIEQMRLFHSRRLGLPYERITSTNSDARANRITAYLNLIDEQVHDQVRALQASPFEPGSEITRYFELLPDSPLRSAYKSMLSMSDTAERTARQESLRDQAVPGTIDVNIMTKVDRDKHRGGTKLPPQSGDAMAALRGYARSTLRSSIIFSAGINCRLFGYLESFADFFPDESGSLRKRIILKVSDFRSAVIQGKYLAKRGLWVSEYRIESGLNCGGHAFATEGLLMGPILQEFVSRRAELTDRLHEVYTRALSAQKRQAVPGPHEVRFTVQGGIGTARESQFLIDHYGVDGTGWGTPFLLVPEVTNVDDAHLARLASAGKNDVYLSDHSPLGVPFWSLRTSASEETHQARIEANTPGSPCPKGYVAFDTEFSGAPVCSASRTYQQRKLAQIATADISDEQRRILRERVIARSCICHDLAGGATLKYGIDPAARTAVCCGPIIASFTRTASLEEMVNHIYGRASLNSNMIRSHLFVRELAIYIDYLRREVEKTSEELREKTSKGFNEFKRNLVGAIDYYRGLAEVIGDDCRVRFLNDLDLMFAELETILPAVPAPVSPQAVIL
jgi:hypothetical protein